MSNKKFFEKRKKQMELWLVVICGFLAVLTWKLHRIDRVLHKEEKKHKNEMYWGYGKKK
jgi:hypothetical protein